MLLLGTTDKLQLVTSAAVAVDVSAHFVDSGAPPTPQNPQLTAISTATTTDIVAAPGAGQRNVQSLLARNKGATSDDLTVVLNRSATAYELFKATLQAGETLSYLDGVGFQIRDANGALKVAQSGSGRWLKTTVLTAGTTFTTGPETKSIFVRLQGGGAGGGGCTSVASAAGAGGGGGAGSYAEKTFTVTPNTNYTYAIGALGAGVSGAAGAAGGATTFAVGATTVTAPGGSGGTLGTATTTLTARLGGAGGAIATNGDLNAAGENGQPGFVLIVATAIGHGGNGGGSVFGKGGNGVIAAGNGNAAIGYGAGGGGALTGASAVRTGGSGVAGIIIIDEYA
jgi:hypothetical protein